MPKKRKSSVSRGKKDRRDNKHKRPKVEESEVTIPAVCSTCKKQGQKYFHVEWCPECQKALCSSCSQRHKQTRSSKDHETITHDNYLKLPPFLKNFNRNCPDHKMIYQYICREHDQLICNKCLKAQHKKCMETPILKDIVGKNKTPNAFECVTREMKKTSDILQNSIREQQRNLDDIQNQKKEMTRHVEGSMERIITHLKEIKKSMLSEIDTIVKENENEILMTIQKLQTMEKQISEIIDQKESIELYATNLEAFIGIKELKKFADESMLNLTKLSDIGALVHTNITLDQAKGIEELLKNEKLFGYIRVTKTPNSLETSKPQQAQMMAHLIPEQLQLQQEVKLNNGFHVGCCTLPSGLMVIADYKTHQLKLINPDGTIKSTIRGKEFPIDVTAVDENHVAVSYYRKGSTIIIVDVSREKVIKTLSAVDAVSGISYANGHIIFCVPDTGIKRINVNTETIDNIYNDETVTVDSRVVASSDRICYTCPGFDTNSVTVLNSQYNVIFKFEDISLLRYPWGVTIDSHHNVYVAGYFLFSNLVVISPDGKKVHQLLSKEDGLDSPTGVLYCHHTNQLIVVNSKNTVHKYSLE